jgi:hypothetical protein
VQQPIPPIELPNVECDYQPEPDSLAGFIAGLPEKVDELLMAANWRPDPNGGFAP